MRRNIQLHLFFSMLNEWAEMAKYYKQMFPCMLYHCRAGSVGQIISRIRAHGEDRNHMLAARTMHARLCTEPHCHTSCKGNSDFFKSAIIDLYLIKVVESRV